MSEEREYWFEVREVIVRDACVTAKSAAEARTLLQAWGNPGGQRLGLTDEEGGPIALNDYGSEGFTFRSIKPPA